MTIARRVVVRGRVQGVAFRWTARERARELAVGGWIRNLSDGRVEAHVEGDPGNVERMLAWLERGPSGARVDAVEVEDVAATGAPGFTVTR